MYTFTTPATELAGDIVESGIPYLEKLRDRGFVIELLTKGGPSEWCVSSYSDRIRLLPLLLATAGRVPEAVRFVDEVLPEAQRRDQRVPGYATFAAWFRKTFVK